MHAAGHLYDEHPGKRPIYKNAGRGEPGSDPDTGKPWGAAGGQSGCSCRVTHKQRDHILSTWSLCYIQVV
ncbi:DUF3678 domain-containing protein [Chitinophaga sp. XS-30]|nr:DUF3678 domain-containing protein [Chitinophaga sp. XS-30]